jgi:penicillin-binding protein 2
VIHCDGALYEGPTRYGCDGVHGSVDFGRALEVSCNVFFFHAGRRVGSRRLAARARAFGFGSSTGLSLGGEELGGAVPAGDPLNLAVGQGKLLVTPIQAACMVATLAHGGRLLRPHLRPEQTRGDAPPSVPVPPVVGPEALAEIREGMRRVVLSGTGSHAGLGAYQVLGKTGTAQVGKRDEGGPSPHAWFVCYGPDAAPTLAVAVVVEHGGAGGEVAAPIAAALFRAQAAASEPEAVGEVPPAPGGGDS